MGLKRATKFDPRGLIAESYEIEGLEEQGARAIFLDWAMMDGGDDPYAAISKLWELYGVSNPEHPMSMLLKQGFSNQNPTRRVGRRRKPI